MSLITTWSGIRSLKLFRKRTPNSGPSHISRLPPELLALIFELGRLLYQPEEELYGAPKYPLIISSVCRLWRNVALNITPAIWCTILITPYRTLDIPLLYLRRSGDVLLDITLRLNLTETTNQIKPTGLHNCFNLIFQYSHRWRHLEFINYKGGLPYISSNALVRSVRAPNLTMLYLHGNFSDHILQVFVDDGAPMLSELTVYRLAKFYGQFSPFSSIKTLQMKYCGYEMDNVEFCSFLESFPSLRRLILMASGARTLVTGEHHPVVLPNLVELTSTHTEILELLVLDLRTPLLRVVDLDLSGRTLFFESLGTYPKSLPSVEKLTVTGNLIRVLQKVPAVFPNVRDLDLSETLVKPVLASEGLGFEQARYWASLEKLTIRGWSRESDDRYLISFVKGLLGWHGHCIQEIKLILRENPFRSVVELEEAFKELEVRLCIVVTPLRALP